MRRTRRTAGVDLIGVAGEVGIGLLPQTNAAVVRAWTARKPSFNGGSEVVLFCFSFWVIKVGKGGAW